MPANPALMVAVPMSSTIVFSVFQSPKVVHDTAGTQCGTGVVGVVGILFDVDRIWPVDLGRTGAMVEVGRTDLRLSAGGNFACVDILRPGLGVGRDEGVDRPTELLADTLRRMNDVEDVDRPPELWPDTLRRMLGVEDVIPSPTL